MPKDAKSKTLVSHGPCFGADTSGLNTDNDSDFIRKRVHKLFEMRGRGTGHALEDWPRAEKEMKEGLRIRVSPSPKAWSSMPVNNGNAKL